MPRASRCRLKSFGGLVWHCDAVCSLDLVGPLRSLIAAKPAFGIAGPTGHHKTFLTGSLLSNVILEIS